MILLVVVIVALVLIARASGDLSDPDPGTTTTITSDPVAPSTALVVNDFELEAAKTQLKKTRQQNVQLRRQLASVKKHLKERWQPTVDYAIRLASAVTGVSHAALRAVASCESGFYAYAKNGKYKGIFQLGWSPFGFSPFDPVANALSAAMTVVHDGSWRQWECKP